MVDRAGAAFHVVHVSIRIIAFFEETPVLLLHRQPQPVKVVLILVARNRFARVVNDAELQLHRSQSICAGQVIQLVADRLEQALLAAMQEVALLDVGAKAQAPPGSLQFPTPVVRHFKIVAAVEAELHRVLAHRVAPHAAATAEADVVVHLAVHDHGAGPEIIVAAVSVVRQTRRPAHGLGKLVALGDELIDRQPVHLLRRYGERHAVRPRIARLHRAAPGGDAVIDEVGKVRLWIVRVGHAHRTRTGVRDRDAITDQPPVRLHGRRNLGGERVVACREITGGAEVVHRHGNPVGGVGVGRVGQLDVSARIHNLIFQRHRAHAVGVRDLGGDLHRHAARRLLGRVLDLADLRRRVVGEDGVDRARRRSGAAGTAGLPDEPGVKKEIAAAGDGGVMRLHRDRVQAVDQQAARTAAQIEGDKVQVLQRADRRAAERDFPRRHVRAAVHHERAVDPALEAVVILRLQNQPGVLRRVRDGELLAEKN